MRPAYGLALLAFVGGCFTTRSARTTPTQPPAVRITFAGQDCAAHAGRDGSPVWRDLGVHVRVDNPTSETLHIAEDSIRLLVDGAYATALRAPAVVDVAPRSTALLELKFEHHALCEPDRTFAIAWNDALVLDDALLRMDNLTFHP